MPRSSLKKMLLEEVERRDPEVQTADDRPSLKQIAKRRGLFGESNDEVPPAAQRSQLTETLGSDYPIPDWLITENYVDEVVGPLKGGKEGDVSLVVRSAPGAQNLLALKEYRDPSRRAFRRDQIYREGRKVARQSRIVKAVALGTSYGRKIMSEQWPEMEYFWLRRLWAAGATVPYPVEGGPSLLMQYIGDEDQAAPRLVDSRLTRPEAEELLRQVLDNIRIFAAEGVVHADLSAFNVLVWEGEAWIIDFPQAVDLAFNPHAMELLQRDIENICRYFEKYRIHVDPGEEFAQAIAAFV